jgi:hypothetical protein
LTIRELLGLIIDAIQRLEHFVGLSDSNSTDTVVGRINQTLHPIYEEKIITNNQFVPTKTPVHIGSWCVNGICQVYDPETKCIYDLDNILFVDGYFKLDTNQFDGKIARITYFYKMDNL